MEELEAVVRATLEEGTGGMWGEDCGTLSTEGGTGTLLPDITHVSDTKGSDNDIDEVSSVRHTLNH